MPRLDQIEDPEREPTAEFWLGKSLHHTHYRLSPSERALDKLKRPLATLGEFAAVVIEENGYPW